MRIEKLSVSEEIKQNLAQMGFVRTTDIQYKSIPAIQKGEDVLAVAQTGTGKTAAFAIPIVDRIHNLNLKKKSSSLSCLILVPTRELASQIGKVFSNLSKRTRASSYAIYGGVDQDPQIRQLVGGVNILISTPGRMFDLIHQGFIDVSTVEMLVLDEADHMLDLGFIDDIKSVKKKIPQKHQTLFFSATINSKIKKMAYSQIRANALRIQVSPQNKISKNVSHFVVKVAMDDKRHLLVNFVEQVAQARLMVFVRTQVRAERVRAHLAKHKISAQVLHGGMEQQDREESLEHFRTGQCNLLIATDVSARGIDVAKISHVINYDVPDVAENYVHRVGRTGRGFEKGEALTFYSDEEKDKLVAVESFLGREIPPLKLDGLYFNSVSRDEIENLEVSEIIDLVDAEFAKPDKKKRGAASKGRKKKKAKKAK